MAFIEADQYEALLNSFPFMHSSYVLMTRPQHKSAPMYSSLLSFSWEIWVTSLVMLFICSLTVAYLEKRRTLPEIWYHGQQLLGQSRPMQFRTTMGRLLALLWSFKVFLILNLFTGCITTTFTLVGNNLIDSFEDILKVPAYRIAISSMSDIPKDFFNGTCSKLREELQTRVWNLKFGEEGTEEVLKLFDENKLAYFENKLIIEDRLETVSIVLGRSSGLRYGKEEYMPKFKGLIFYPRTPNGFRETVNIRIMKFLETGQLKHADLRINWRNSMILTGDCVPETTYKDLDLKELQPFIIFFYLGLLFSCFVLICEKMLCRM